LDDDEVKFYFAKEFLPALARDCASPFALQERQEGYCSPSPGW